MILVVSSQFTLGNAITLLTVLALGVVGFFHLRGLSRGQLEETGKFWRDQIDPLKVVIEEQRTRLEQVTTERDEQRRMKHEIRNELDAERKTRDLTPIVAALNTQAEALQHFEDTLTERIGACVDSQQQTAQILEALVRNVSDLNAKIAA